MNRGRGTVDSSIRDGSATAPFPNVIKMKIEPFWADTEVAGNAVEVAHCPNLGKICVESVGLARPARNVVGAPAVHHGHLIEIDAVAMRRQGDAS